MNDSVKQVTPRKFRARHRNRLVVAFVLALVGSVLAQWYFIPYPHPYFAVDGEYWFYPAMGLMASMIFVLVARILGFVLKRRETYWKDKG